MSVQTMSSITYLQAATPVLWEELPVELWFEIIKFLHNTPTIFALRLLSPLFHEYVTVCFSVYYKRYFRVPSEPDPNLPSLKRKYYREIRYNECFYNYKYKKYFRACTERECENCNIYTPLAKPSYRYCFSNEHYKYLHVRHFIKHHMHMSYAKRVIKFPQVEQMSREEHRKWHYYRTTLEWKKKGYDIKYIYDWYYYDVPKINVITLPTSDEIIMSEVKDCKGVRGKKGIRGKKEKRGKEKKGKRKRKGKRERKKTRTKERNRDYRNKYYLNETKNMYDPPNYYESGEYEEKMFDMWFDIVYEAYNA